MLCYVAFLCLQWHSIREQRGTHKKGKEWRLVIHGPAKRWRMPSFSSVLLHIWCCYKTYTIKGLLLCPWCVVTGKPASPETQLYYYTTRTTTGHHATNHFFREKSRKNLDKLRFYWANMRKKHACYGSLEWNEQFGERGSNHSFLVPAFYQRLLFGAFIR